MLYNLFCFFIKVFLNSLQMGSLCFYRFFVFPIKSARGLLLFPSCMPFSCFFKSASSCKTADWFSSIIFICSNKTLICWCSWSMFPANIIFNNSSTLSILLMFSITVPDVIFLLPWICDVAYSNKKLPAHFWGSQVIWYSIFCFYLWIFLNKLPLPDFGLG